MKTKLAEMREEIETMKLQTPYNFCDRWCEKCSEDIKNTCTVYKKCREKEKEHVTHGINPNDPDVLFADIFNNFHETLTMLKEFSEQEGIDISKLPDTNLSEDFDEKKWLTYPLYSLSKKYFNSIDTLFHYAYFSQEEFSDEANDYLDALMWYRSLLPAKSYRIVQDLYGNDNNDDEEFGIFDALGQIDILKKAIEQSKNALQYVIKQRLCFMTKAIDPLHILEEVSQELQNLEKNIGVELAVFGGS
ncbi:hypothetical protein ACFL56_02730 [Candidatus Margulisiibacteriota bacterium]